MTTTTTTTISNLSRDLLEEIISRVPLESMRAVRSTCREWDTLSNGGIFTKMHIGKATEAREGKSWMILLMDHNLYLNSLALNVDDPSTEPKGKHISCLKDSDQVKIHRVFECEGLLLCILKNDTTRVVVWNPYLGQTRWVEACRITFRCPVFEERRYMYALGYQSKKKTSCRSHKILRFMAYLTFPRKLTVRVFKGYEIYNLESGVWKTIDVIPKWDICCDSHGVSLKGNTYWRARPRNSRDDELLANCIIGFDFTRERFGPLLPLPFRALDDEVVTLSCVRQEKLAVLFQPNVTETKTEVWITDRINTKQVSWIKFVTCMIPTSFRSGSFFIDEEKKLAVVFYRHYYHHRYTIHIFGEAGYFKKLPLQKCDTRMPCHVVPYVPSLVQIYQATIKR